MGRRFDFRCSGCGKTVSPVFLIGDPPMCVECREGHRRAAAAHHSHIPRQEEAPTEALRTLGFSLAWLTFLGGLWFGIPAFFVGLTLANREDAAVASAGRVIISVAVFVSPIHFAFWTFVTWLCRAMIVSALLAGHP